MLDFYLIDDSQPKRKQPGQDLVYLGGMEANTFYQMQAEGIIEARLDYYGDFRWSSEVVAKMLRMLQMKQKPTCLEREAAFAAILQKAVDVRSGIAAFGD